MIGPLGAILAVPLTLMAKALLIYIDPATRWADVLLSSSSPRKPDDDAAESTATADDPPGGDPDVPPGTVASTP